MRIYIKGLKSLGAENYIALGRKLTFLVGPNSAGKSVLLMALDKLSGDWINREFDYDLIHTNPNRGDAIEGIQSLGVEWQHKKTKYGLFDSHCLLYRNELREKNVNPREIHRSGLKFARDDGAGNFDANVFGYKQYYKDDVFLLQQKRLIRENSWADLLGRLDKKAVDNNLFFELAIDCQFLGASTREILSTINDWILAVFQRKIETIREVISGDAESKNEAKRLSALKFLTSLYDDQTQSFKNNLFIWWPAAIEDCASGYKGKEKQRFTNIFSKNTAIIRKIERVLVRGFEQSYPGSSFKCGIVSADRSIPTEKDLNGIVDMQTEDTMFREIMVSEIDFKWANEGQNKNNEGLIHKINRALRDDLFFDNGYQLSIDVRAMVNHGEWTTNEIEKSDEEREFYCRISLRDSHGRSLGFEDVGSGIGYVLPVLIEIFRPKNNGKTVFLQQPELHLHPAMQANLTDVLIRAASGKRIIAETHSEHLILRALKRIRQTSSKTIKDPELKLYPEDVAVNYFEPLGDGTTKVHILRVSSDGDFIDRWPNGFFAERDGELFDE